MNPPFDRSDAALRAWLELGPERGRPEALERALAATRRVPQRPGWTFPGSWLPRQLPVLHANAARPVLYIVLAALLAAAVVATMLYSGLQKRVPLTGPIGNGLIAY